MQNEFRVSHGRRRIEFSLWFSEIYIILF